MTTEQNPSAEVAAELDDSIAEAEELLAEARAFLEEDE